jgi:hypothetical protein
MSAPGPFETEREARAWAHAAIPPDPDRVTQAPSQRAEFLLRTLQGAGVEVSEFEARTLHWMSQWEDYTTAIIARWVAQAADRSREGEARS